MDVSRLTIENGIELSDGKRIPRIGFGTYELEKGDVAKNAVLAALEAGYRHVDCARLYDNERSVGDALRESGMARGDIFVTSKVWNDRQISGEIRQSVEETLTALQLDYLDLLLIHWPVEGRYRHTWEQFQLLQEEGLVRSIGVSNFNRAQLDDLVSDGDPSPVVDQMEYHPYLRDMDALARCRELHCAYEAWSPLARGACLADPVIVDIARAHGVQPAQVVLAWMLQADIIPLPRSSKAERVAGNLEAFDVRLTEVEAAAIDALECGRASHEGVDPVHFGPILNSIPSPHD